MRYLEPSAASLRLPVIGQGTWGFGDNRSVRPTQNYPKVALTLTSCFIGAGFTVARWPLPEPDPPQADAVELTAYVAKLVAALRSRSCVV